MYPFWNICHSIVAALLQYYYYYGHISRAAWTTRSQAHPVDRSDEHSQDVFDIQPPPPAECPMPSTPAAASSSTSGQAIGTPVSFTPTQPAEAVHLAYKKMRLLPLFDRVRDALAATEMGMLEAQISDDRHVTVCANGDCFFACIAASLNVAAWCVLPLIAQEGLARNLRYEFADFLDDIGQTDRAARLRKGAHEYVYSDDIILSLIHISEPTRPRLM